ncbi:hypothetical protein [Atopobium sp. oral taxon 416]|nr:hypothetical protein [Atopobium sp. oral taxon 416]
MLDFTNSDGLVAEPCGDLSRCAAIRFNLRFSSVTKEPMSH